MAKTHWDSAEFHYWYSNIPIAEQKRRVWNDLRADQRKAYEEWLSFVKFAQVAPLDIDPRTIENRKPPEPDILCRISQERQYFELGEVTDEGLAQQSGIAAKQKQDIFAGAYSELNPLCRILDQKCGKNYVTNGLPLHLLLHYTVGHQVPNTNLLRTEISRSRPMIAKKLKGSVFNTVWLYDGWNKEVIDFVER